MASIVLTIIGRICYLDIGAIFTRVVFLSVAAGAKKWGRLCPTSEIVCFSGIYFYIPMWKTLFFH